MTDETTRRRFIRTASLGVLAAVAGCGGTGASNVSNGTTGEPTTVDVGTMTETEAMATETGMEETDAEATDGETEAETTEAAQATLRIVHAAPDAPAVDIAVDGETVVTGATYQAVTEYLVLNAGEHTLTVSADGESVFEETVTLEAGPQTAVALGEVNGDNQPFTVAVFADDTSLPASGESRARLIHAAPDAPAVDVTVEDGAQTVFDEVAFGAASEAVTVPAGSYTFEIRPASAADDGEVVTTATAELAGETAYTAFATGYLEPSGDQPAFQVMFVVDAGEQATPTGTATESPGMGTEDGTPGMNTETDTAGTETDVTETAVGTEVGETATDGTTETATEEATAMETETGVGTGTETEMETEMGTEAETETP